MFTDALFDHGRSVFVGRDHDHQGFTRPGIAQSGQDRVLVAQDAGLQDLQTMLADVLPVAGEGREQGAVSSSVIRERDSRKSALVGDDREPEISPEKTTAGKDECAAVRQLALDPDLSAVQLDQFFRDVESQAQPLAAVVDRIGVLI